MAFGGVFFGGIALGALIVASVIRIILAIIYFAFSLFTIKIASGLVFPNASLQIEWAVLAAAIISAASIIGKDR